MELIQHTHEGKSEIIKYNILTKKSSAYPGGTISLDKVDNEALPYLTRVITKDGFTVHGSHFASQHEAIDDYSERD